jgi:hypothetical protein
LPPLSGLAASLCDPIFSLSGDLSRILRVSLWPADFNFQIANPETGFEIGRDWFDGSSRVSTPAADVVQSR